MATEIIIGEKFGLRDVDPETNVPSEQVTLHETEDGAKNAAQKSVGRAPITWMGGPDGGTIGVIRGKQCFKIEMGLHVQIKRRPRVLYVIPLPWSVFADQFRPGQSDGTSS